MQCTVRHLAICCENVPPYTYTCNMTPACSKVRNRCSILTTLSLAGCGLSQASAWYQISDLYCSCRVILLYQNNQLRANLFAPGSAWLQRSKDYKAAAEPLDTQIRLQGPALLARPRMMPSTDQAEVFCHF